MQGGGLKQGLEIGAVAFAQGCGAGAYRLQDGGALAGDVGDGIIHALFGHDAGHFLEHAGGRAAPFDVGKRRGQFVDLRQPHSVRGFGGFLEALAVFPVRRLFGCGEFAAVRFCDGFL